MRNLLALAICCASAAQALADELPYPPTYFSEFRVALGIANEVVEKCPKLAFNQDYFDETLEDVLKKLEQDGFTREGWEQEMREVPVGIIGQVSLEFYRAFGVRDDRPESYCDGGIGAMKQKTAVGKFLEYREKI